MNRTRFSSVLAMVLLAAILLPSFLHAQITFERTYGDTSYDGALSVQQTSDGGFIITGYATPRGRSDYNIYLIKTNAYGDTLWTRTFGGAGYDVGYSVEQTVDGGYVLTGNTASGGGADDVFLLKTNANGDTLWSRRYGGSDYDDGSWVEQTTDGGFIIAAITYSFGNGESDIYLIRTDTAGYPVWTKTFGGGNWDESWTVQQTFDGGFIVSGYTNNFGGGRYDALLIKTDANGNELWTKTYGGAGTDYGFQVQQTTDSGFVMVGYTNSYGAGQYSVYLIRTDSKGDTLWTRTYGGGLDDWGYSVQQTKDGGYVIAGWTNSFGAGNEDIYVVKTDANGNATWSRTYGGADYDEGASVQPTADGGYIVAGFTRSYGAGHKNDVYLIKTDSLGNVGVAEPGTNPTRDPALSLSCEPNPSSGTTRISLTPQASSSKPLTLCIYDSQGCQVHSVSGIRTSSFPLDLRDLPSGTYVCRLITAFGQTATQPVVIAR